MVWSEWIVGPDCSDNVTGPGFVFARTRLPQARTLVQIGLKAMFQGPDFIGINLIVDRKRSSTCATDAMVFFEPTNCFGMAFPTVGALQINSLVFDQIKDIHGEAP